MSRLTVSPRIRRSTIAGFDLASATSTPLDWVVSVAPDGAAVAVDYSYNGERGRVRIATRAAGQPFSAARTYRTGDFNGDEQPALAVHDGRYLVAFAAQSMTGSSLLGRLEAVTGRAGERPGPAVTVPISSAQVPDVAAVLPPNGPPTLLTTTQRSTECVACHSLHDRFGIDTFHFSARPPRRPRGVSVRVAPSQRLGRPQALRVRVTCPRRCAVRVAGSVTSEAGEFDTSRSLRRGTTVLRVPYASGGGSAPFRPLRRARRTRLGIAVDEASVRAAPSPDCGCPAMTRPCARVEREARVGTGSRADHSVVWHRRRALTQLNPAPGPTG